MIRDILIPTLMDMFPGRGLRTGAPPGPIAVFPAAHPEVGDLTIYDDGEEATLCIGTITHGHFNPYDSSLSEEEAASLVTEDVVDFLRSLFADRVLLWKSKGGGSGGWRVMGQRSSQTMWGLDGSLPFLRPADLTYFWSGPVKNPKAR